MNKRKIIFRIITFLIFLFLFIYLLINIKEKGVLEVDKFNDFLREVVRNNTLTPIIKSLTNIGGTSILIIESLIIFLLFNDKKVGLFIPINLALSAGLNHLIKSFIKRPRPDIIYHLIKQGGWSFPSGHAMVSLSFYGFLIYLVIKYIKKRNLRDFLVVILSLIIIFVGFSRIYLGVHYTSDVLGGYTLGIMYMMIYTTIFDLIIGRKNSNEKNKEVNR